MASHGAFRNGLHRAVARAGIVFRDPDNQPGHRKPDHAAEEQVNRPKARTSRRHRAKAKHQIGQRQQHNQRQDAGDDKAAIHGAHDGIIRRQLHKVSADDGRHHANRTDGQRIEHAAHHHGRIGKGNRRQHHGGNHRHRIGFEQISGHASAVADIIADIVSDGRGVAGVILRDAGFHLAHHIAANIRTLGEDAAAQARKNRNQRSAEAKRHQRINHRAAIGRITTKYRQDQEINSNTQQRQAGHQHPGDGARFKGDIQPGGERLNRGLRGAEIGAHRHIHADKARSTRKHRAKRKANGHHQAKAPGHQGEKDHAHNGNGAVLPLQIGRCAFLNGESNFLHPRRTGIARKHILGSDHTIGDGQRSKRDHQDQR